MNEKIKSDGSTASYYELPKGCSELQELISYKNMNAQIGEIFRACYRYGQVEHSERLRDAKKILFYAKAEIERIEKYEVADPDDGWFIHTGTEMPVSEDTLVIAKLSCGEEWGPYKAQSFHWGVSKVVGRNIVAYRIVKDQ